MCVRREGRRIAQVRVPIKDAAGELLDSAIPGTEFK
jgi:hypothetical protein